VTENLQLRALKIHGHYVVILLLNLPWRGGKNFGREETKLWELKCSGICSGGKTSKRIYVIRLGFDAGIDRLRNRTSNATLNLGTNSALAQNRSTSRMLAVQH
jgi:hypothetical protein